MKTILVLTITLLTAYSFAAELFKTVSIDELDSLIKKESKIFVYDVNVDSTREHVGTLPNAQFIDSATQYNISSSLPKDKASRLIFYCANEMCTSSHIAATRAVEAGFKNVSVLKAGIYGWKKANKQLVPVKTKSSANQTSSSVEPGEAKALVDSARAIIVDVRENEERHEIIEGELWFPMSKASDLNAWNAFKAELPKDKTIIVHCAAGVRSKKISERLVKEGLRSLYFNSVDQWKLSGLQVAAGPAK